jgi:DMSO/TMAO reductase YedYZ molybdopterin-dependent catalytic subunit
MKTGKSAMSRRKFIRITSTTLALAGLPSAARMARADVLPPTGFGGPTPNANFYVTSYSKTPKVDVAKWMLRIHGLVDQPLQFTYDDIKRLPSVNQNLTLECIGNPPDGRAISNAEWTGVMLRPLLERAGVGHNAVYAVMRAADGFSTGVPVAEIMRGENWLAYLMNGVPLPPVHGYPLRLFIPGKYGMKQPKWLTEIEFVDHQFIGYWEARGESKEAWRKVNSGFFYPQAQPHGGTLDILPFRILDLLSLSEIASVKAPVELTGWALAGPAGIKRVEVSTDDGATWREAHLVENKSPYVWTVWKYHFAPAKPGEYTLRVRATDGEGAIQPKYNPDSRIWRSGQPRIRLEVTSLA